MHFGDLTPYEYDAGDPVPHILNVGWLSRDHAFPVGPPNPTLIEALLGLVAHPVNLYRGYHCCDLCPPPPAKLLDGRLVPDPPQEMLGNGEIRVEGRDGNIYVAPVLVLHYVTVHGYLPPQDFVDAAIATTA